jgi:hypothetical protein
VTTAAEHVATPWLDYEKAAAYTLLTVRSLHTLVSSRQIPVYGSPRCRRFRKDMLDLWLINRPRAMRKWEEELRRTW